MQLERPLTSFSHGAGCGCKLGPSDLLEVLGSLSMPATPQDVLVSAETGDDAAVVRIADGQALIATLDFFTPIVDDPYDWGRIAATNALSDVYAMGGRPITDPEPKFGMVALGLSEADRLVRNSTAPADARLFLTKPLGTGIVSTGIKRGVTADELISRAVDLMTTPNDAAAAAMVEVGAEAATDVTGFGLLGHLQRMLQASGVGATVDAAVVPVLEGVRELAEAGGGSGGTKRNHAFLGPHVQWGRLTEPEQLVLADAQTSGGLLIAATDHEWMGEVLRGASVPFAEIGRTVTGRPGTIAVTGRRAPAWRPPARG